MKKIIAIVFVALFVLVGTGLLGIKYFTKEKLIEAPESFVMNSYRMMHERFHSR